MTSLKVFVNSVGQNSSGNIKQFKLYKALKTMNNYNIFLYIIRHPEYYIGNLIFIHMVMV